MGSSSGRATGNERVLDGERTSQDSSGIRLKRPCHLKTRHRSQQAAATSDQRPATSCQMKRNCASRVGFGNSVDCGRASLGGAPYENAPGEARRIVPYPSGNWSLAAGCYASPRSSFRTAVSIGNNVAVAQTTNAAPNPRIISIGCASPPNAWALRYE